VNKLVEAVLSNKELWGEDISEFEPFSKSVADKLSSMITNGVRNTINNI